MVERDEAKGMANKSGSPTDWQTVTSSCNLVQPTWVVTNSTGMKSSTCIYYIFTNAAEMCLKAVSKSTGCSDHNIVAISRKTRVQKAGTLYSV